MDQRQQNKAAKRIKEHFEANTSNTTEGIVEAVMQDLRLAPSDQLKDELMSLARQVHDEIQDEDFDYDHMSDQSFPASDPPPVP